MPHPTPKKAKKPRRVAKNCDDCVGMGRLRREEFDSAGYPVTRWDTCSTCLGRGEVL